MHNNIVYSSQSSLLFVLGNYSLMFRSSISRQALTESAVLNFLNWKLINYSQLILNDFQENSVMHTWPKQISRLRNHNLWSITVIDSYALTNKN